MRQYELKQIKKREITDEGNFITLVDGSRHQVDRMAGNGRWAAVYDDGEIEILSSKLLNTEGNDGEMGEGSGTGTE